MYIYVIITEKKLDVGKVYTIPYQITVTLPLELEALLHSFHDN